MNGRARASSRTRTQKAGSDGVYGIMLESQDKKQVQSCQKSKYESKTCANVMLTAASDANCVYPQSIAKIQFCTCRKMKR